MNMITSFELCITKCFIQVYGDIFYQLWKQLICQVQEGWQHRMYTAMDSPLNYKGVVFYFIKSNTVTDITYEHILCIYQY